MSFSSAIYQGLVYHKRFKPKVHQLKYRVCSFLFDLDELDELDRALPFFSHNKWNIVSFWDKDHGAGEKQNLRLYVEQTLKQAGYTDKVGAIKLLCYPRLFGYVFNPLSVYYCYDTKGQLQTIIYEVSNTFSQRHSYVIPVEETDQPYVHQKCQKGFYVSPFMEMDCEYAFRMKKPGDDISVFIDQSDPEGRILSAYFKGQKTPLDNNALVKMIAKYPLMTLKVMAGIHWEAFLLWRKGLKLIKRPAPPPSPITVIPSRHMESET